MRLANGVVGDDNGQESLPTVGNATQNASHFAVTVSAKHSTAFIIKAIIIRAMGGLMCIAQKGMHTNILKW